MQIEALSEKDLRDIMAKKGYIVYDDGHPNIIGIRTANRSANSFDDFIYVFGKDFPLTRYRATTDPGLTYLLRPVAGSKGTAILVPGQYVDAYVIGMHRKKQMALIQLGRPVKVFRDANGDKILDMKPETITEGFFGINLHHAGWMESDLVGPWSAGCQVWKNAVEHSAMITKFQSLSKMYAFKNFTYTLLVAADFQ